MTNQGYFKEGSVLILPEILGRHRDRDPYFIIKRVYPGGMGICVRLEHKSTGFEYALKCVKPELIGKKSSRDRFYDELMVWLSASVCSLIAEAIEIVRINEFPCVLATWMSGGDLHSRIKKLTPQEKFEVILRTVRGLKWAYENLGIIHRDVKPSNILRDKDGLSYITDWGLARPVMNQISSINSPLQENSFDRPDRTQTGSFVGTILYASPEQIEGLKDIDHRADIYSLGCLFYELETGAPPFTGNSALEIAYKQMHEKAPVLGGLFHRTDLGLEQIISKCLEKDPSRRYKTYQALESDLLVIAKDRGFDINLCEPSERYDRSHIGKGYKEFKKFLIKSTIKGNVGYAVGEHSQMKKYLEEASNLIALGRYQEAEQILWHFYFPDLSSPGEKFLLGHTSALDYAFCCMNISGRLTDALDICERLKDIQDKPDTYYVNYSLALLRSSQPDKAKSICEEGLVLFPGNLDLIGNYTISLLLLSQLDAALESAHKRIKIQRDIHSIEELASVLAALRREERNGDLPQAIEFGKKEGKLINEGLALNPGYMSLMLAEIKLFRFSHDATTVGKICNSYITSNEVHIHLRELALVELLYQLKNERSFDRLFSVIEKFVGHIQDDEIKAEIIEIKMSTLAENFMIGKDNPDGERVLIKEVVDYYLSTDPSPKLNPTMKARVLEWMAKFDRANELLVNQIKENPKNWDAIRAMALLRQRTDLKDEAYFYGKKLIDIAPWKAESYDTVKYIAKRFDDESLAREMESKGNSVFNKEMDLFRELRDSLGEPIMMKARN